MASDKELDGELDKLPSDATFSGNVPTLNQNPEKNVRYIYIFYNNIVVM